MKAINVLWSQGLINPSGICTRIFYIPREDILEFPQIYNHAGSAPGAEFENDFVLKPDKYWYELYSTEGKGKVTFESVGETDCKMFLNKGTFSFPNLSYQAKQFAMVTLNSNCVFLVPEKTGYAVVLGGKLYRSTVEVKGDSGDAPGSAKGITIDVTAPDVVPLPMYVFNVLLSGGRSFNLEEGGYEQF